MIKLLSIFLILGFFGCNGEKADPSRTYIPLSLLEKYTYKYAGTLPNSSKPFDTIYKSAYVLNKYNETIEFEVLDTLGKLNLPFHFNNNYNLKNLFNTDQDIIAVGKDKQYLVSPSKITICEFNKCHFYYVLNGSRYFAYTKSLEVNYSSLTEKEKRIQYFDFADPNYFKESNIHAFFEIDSIFCFLSYDDFIPSIGLLNQDIGDYGIELISINEIPVQEYLRGLCELPPKIKRMR